MVQAVFYLQCPRAPRCSLGQGAKYDIPMPFGGWTFHTKHAPILKNSDNSTSAESTGAWKRELGMTTVRG